MMRKELLVLIVLLLLSWLYLGSAFGYHSLVGGDDWYMFAISSLNQLPACTGIPNFHQPYRPLHPTPICVVYQLFGRSSLALTNLSVAAFGLTAFAWYGISRNLFRLTSALALLVAILYLSYPDDSGRYSLTGGARQFGPMLTLLGVWFMLSFWDRPSQYWRLVVGMLASFAGFLSYETLLLVWGVGLPLALAYKAGRLTRRWVWVSALIVLWVGAVLVWHFLISPRTYSETTFVIGGHSISTDPYVWIRQLTDSYALLSVSWQRPFRWISSGLNHAGQDYGTSALVMGMLAAALSILALFAVARLEKAGENLVRRKPLLLAMLFAIPIFVGMFYFAPDIMMHVSEYRSYNHGFAGSLGLLGLVLLFPPGKLRRLVTGSLVVTLIVLMTVASAYIIVQFRTSSAVHCDFMLRLTSQVLRLPQNVYVVVLRVDTPMQRLRDPFMMSSSMAATYYEGPYNPESYDYRRMGYNGYLLLVDSAAKIEGDQLLVNWAENRAGSMHQLQPLPDTIPLEHAILIDYTPYESLRLVSFPAELEGLEIGDGNGGEAYARTHALCDWFDPADFVRATG